MKNIYTNQTTATLVQEGIRRSDVAYEERVTEILQNASEKIQETYEKMEQSLDCVDKVRDFVSDPTKILGNVKTKHGEVAEQVDVHVRNARNIMNGNQPDATFEGIGRTAPEDYKIGNSMVQSKFINNACRSLDESLKHLEKYADFMNGENIYQIPKEQYELLVKIKNGEIPEGVSTRFVNRCRALIQKMEQQTGRPFESAVRPSIATYDEVQLGKIDETLDGYEKEIKDAGSKEIKEIKKERDKQKEQAAAIKAPSWSEALKCSAISAAISGGSAAAFTVYGKTQSGKKITEFDKEDWKDVGYDFCKEGARGGISGLAIYGMTKCGGYSASFAGSIVSTTTGIAALTQDYHNGKITADEYADCAAALSIESGISAVGAVLGQAIIPIPVVGSIVGTAAAKAALEITKHYGGEKERELIAVLQQRYNAIVAVLDDEAINIIGRMDAYYDDMHGFIEALSEEDETLRHHSSIQLCQQVTVPEYKIVHDIYELDLMMN